MDGNVDPDGTSVDVEPAVTENGKQDLLTNGKNENEVELKIVEDEDLVEAGPSSVTESDEKSKCMIGESKSDEAIVVNGKTTEMGETPSKDITNNDPGRLDGTDLDASGNQDQKECSQSAEQKDRPEAADTEEISEQQMEPARTSDVCKSADETADGKTDADTAGAETVTDSEKTNTDLSAKTSDSNEDKSEGEVDKSLVDSTAQDDDKVISDPMKQAEVDSFLTSVCEEIEGLMEAEEEFTDTKEVTEAVQGDSCAGDKSTTVETDAVDKCLELVESAELDQAEGVPVDVESEEIVDSNKRMDVREKDIKLEKFEAENMVLQGELQQARTMIHILQEQARNRQVEHNQEVMSLKLQLYKNQALLKQQRTTSEKQMSDIMAHLMMLEGQLKREQCRVKREMQRKNKLIEEQKVERLKLKEQNEQLYNAIKEIYAMGGMNGYMRDKKKGSSSQDASDSGKSTKDKGKLNMVKDKFLWKNRSSLELNNSDVEKLKTGRMYSSHEDLQNVGRSRGERAVSNLVEGNIHSPQRVGNELKEKFVSSPGMVTNGDFTKSPRKSQNFLYDDLSPKMELSTSVSESSQLSEKSSTSGFQSLSDHDISNSDVSMVSNHHGNSGYREEDDDDDCYFSFSSTRINTVIDEEEITGPHGQMTSMGSMPNISDKFNQQLHSSKDRPHSLSSVDLVSIQQHAEDLSRMLHASKQLEMQTPPSSPSAVQNKTELTPFQTFKTMFKRKGSKNKGKKRSVSLSQTTGEEYREAMKKHFQKYDMS